MLARRLAREQGFDEALLVTPHGRVLEAPTSSIFWVNGGKLMTPPLDDHILASITRALVIDVSGAHEQPCTLDDLIGADEAFLASTIREVQPIATIDEPRIQRRDAGQQRTGGGGRGADPRGAGRLKVLTVIGNRPQFIKAAAVSPALRARPRPR